MVWQPLISLKPTRSLSRNTFLSLFQNPTILESFLVWLCVCKGLLGEETWWWSQECSTWFQDQSLYFPSQCKWSWSFFAKFNAIDNKHTIIHDLLVSTQSIVGDIHTISKETGSDVLTMRVKILWLGENAVKVSRKFLTGSMDILFQPHASFDWLKKSICNTLTYFLRR